MHGLEPNAFVNVHPHVVASSCAIYTPRDQEKGAESPEPTRHGFATWSI